MKRFSLLAVPLFLTACLSAPAFAQAPISWTLGDVDSASHWGPKSGEKFSQALAKATNGKLKITVYPTESLYKGKDSLDAVAKNLAQIYRVAGVHVAGELQILELMDLPLFVPWDYAFRVQVWDALTPMYRELLNKRYGIYLGGILQAEPRMIYLREPFKGLAGLKGRKVRTAGPVETAFTRSIGIVPVTVPPSEIYTGLQQGLLDGNWVADAPHFFNKGFEVTKYIYDVGSAGAGFFVLVNGKALEALPADARKALMSTLPTYLADLREGTHGGAVHGREWLVKEGMTIVPVSPADRATMQRVADEIRESWQKRLDPEAHKIFEKAQKMVKDFDARKKS